jgi:uncharacterized protein YbjT (DUF2867 family)
MVAMTPNSTDPQLTLILGATGRTGRRVMQRLAALDRPTRAGSRHGSPPFNWNAPEGWTAVLDGVGAAYLCFHPDLAIPGAAETVGAFARAAVGAGVSRLVLLSGRGEQEAVRTVALVRAAAAGSATTVTVVRCSWFAQNFSEGFFRDEVLTGHLAVPVGDVLEPFVDLDDVAEVVTAALTDPRHAGQVYEVTGPRLLTFDQAVAEIGDAAGLVVRPVHLPIAEYVDALSAAGEPAEVVELMTYLFTEVLDGRNASLGDGVQRALGRPAQDFTAFARKAAAAGCWSPAPVGSS